jgi:excisionase family DNA binding protein
MSLTKHQPPTGATSRLLEVSHVAHRLSLSEDFVRRLIRRKQLAVIRFGTRYRVDPVELEAFIDRQRIERVIA